MKECVSLFLKKNGVDVLKMGFEGTSNIHLNSFGLNLYIFFYSAVVVQNMKYLT